MEGKAFPFYPSTLPVLHTSQHKAAGRGISCGFSLVLQPQLRDSSAAHLPSLPNCSTRPCGTPTPCAMTSASASWSTSATPKACSSSMRRAFSRRATTRPASSDRIPAPPGASRTLRGRRLPVLRASGRRAGLAPGGSCRPRALPTANVDPGPRAVPGGGGPGRHRVPDKARIRPADAAARPRSGRALRLRHRRRGLWGRPPAALRARRSLERAAIERRAGRSRWPGLSHGRRVPRSKII